VNLSETFQRRCR